MQVEELLKPRYRVEIEFPCATVKVGEIIEGECAYVSAIGDESEGTLQSEKCFMGEFPKVFKKLKWYEERAIEDLPKYVLNKSAIPKTIIPVTWVLEEDTHIFKYEKQLFAIYHGKYYPWGLEPATEEEYLAQTPIH